MNIYPLHENSVVRCGVEEKDFVDRNPIAFKMLAATLAMFNNSGIVEVTREGGNMKIVRVSDTSRAVIGTMRKDRTEFDALMDKIVCTDKIIWKDVNF